ncbi:hypothetical protein PSPO01_05389 [Paraphaeosphaeria sporulosa]
MDAYSYIWYMFLCLCLRTPNPNSNPILLFGITTCPPPPVRLAATPPSHRSLARISHSLSLPAHHNHQLTSAPHSGPALPPSPSSQSQKESDGTYLCLCFGFLLQMMYTYFPFFLRTLLHPSHSFFTDDRTFMPRVCCCIRSPANRDDKLAMAGDDWRHGRAAGVWSAREMVGRRAGVAAERKVRRSGRRSVCASIVAARVDLTVGSWREERKGWAAGLVMRVLREVLGL